MKHQETDLPGVLLLEPAVYHDERGFFVELFNEDRFAALAPLGVPTRIRQTNHSRSVRGALRGLHFQLGRPQGKLVTVLRGEVFDVVADVRRDSPSFGLWTGIRISGDAPRAVWVPAGFAHGFCVLSDVADVVYGCTETYFPEGDAGVRWDDPTLAVQWPIDVPILSPKDAVLPLLAGAALPARAP